MGFFYGEYILSKSVLKQLQTIKAFGKTEWLGCQILDILNLAAVEMQHLIPNVNKHKGSVGFSSPLQVRIS